MTQVIEEGEDSKVNLKDRFEHLFMRSLYKNEDLLFKVIFDKKYRYNVYQEAVRSSQLNDYKEMKSKILNLEPEKLAKDNSYPSLQSFRELEYMEHMSKTRY